MASSTRRNFLQAAVTAGIAATASSLHSKQLAVFQDPAPPMRFGLVTYLWGKDMDLPTVIAACEQSGLGGVELRTEHQHGVEPTLSKTERVAVRKRFEDSPVELIGYGSNAQFHEAEPEKLRANIELAKSYVQLMHDCGGSGVKVKPNGFVPGVAHEATITQIGHALNELAEYGQQYGQQIRVEVHGAGTSALPVMKSIFDVADHPNVAVCWNSNAEDLKGEGVEHNFGLVQARLGDTTHVRELTAGDYPYEQLLRLLHAAKYSGWILLEAHSNPTDKVAALIEQRHEFDRLLARVTDVRV